MDGSVIREPQYHLHSATAHRFTSFRTQIRHGVKRSFQDLRLFQALQSKMSRPA